MTAEQEALLAEARSSLEAAKVLRREGYFGYGVSRAYYAMFYAAEALLLGKGLTFSKHAGVLSAFGQHFVKAGGVPAEYHRYLIQGMDLRQVSDYGRSHEVSVEQCDLQIQHAEDFIRFSKKVIGPTS
jgi:uncharacterized protein (UPF0332 family)